MGVRHVTRAPRDEAGASAGGYLLRTGRCDRSLQDVPEEYLQITEAVFRSLTTELGLRPIRHQDQSQNRAGLLIAGLACQALNLIRTGLKLAGKISAGRPHATGQEAGSALPPLSRRSAPENSQVGRMSCPPPRPLPAASEIASARKAPKRRRKRLQYLYNEKFPLAARPAQIATHHSPHDTLHRLRRCRPG